MKPEINGKPIEVAKSLSAQELKKLVTRIKRAEYDEWLDRCRICFEHYLKGEIEQAEWWSRHAGLLRPWEK